MLGMKNSISFFSDQNTLASITELKKIVSIITHHTKVELQI